MDNKTSISLIAATFLGGMLLALLVKPARPALVPAPADRAPVQDAVPAGGETPTGTPAETVRDLGARMWQAFLDADAAASACRAYQGNVERGGDWQRDHLKTAQEEAAAKAGELDQVAMALKSSLPDEDTAVRAADAVLDLHERRNALWAAWSQIAEFGRYHTVQEIQAPGVTAKQFAAFQMDMAQAQQEETIAAQTAQAAVRRFLVAAGVPATPQEPAMLGSARP